MDAQRARLVQLQLRQNTEELQDYLKGLQSWEEDFKTKDRNLSKKKSILKQTLPPVRSSKAKRPKSEKSQSKLKPEARSASTKANPIHSYDYQSWDKFDVDSACEEVEYGVRESSGSEEDEIEKEKEDEEVEEEEKRRHQAMTEKEKGNALYKDGKYELSVECYSRGMLLDPLSAVLPANRAMALLKLERYAAVEEDCNTALALKGDYVKAYLRRGVARKHLGTLEEAKQDFEAVLRLESGNKQAHSELKMVQQMLKDAERTRLIMQGHVFPVKRAPHLRSKKPLQRITIEDIDGELDTGNTDTAAEVPAAQEQLDADSSGSREQHQQEHTKTEVGSSPAEPGSNRSNTIPKSTVIKTDDSMKTQNSYLATEDECKSSPRELASQNCEGLAVDVQSVVMPPLPCTSLEFRSHWKHLKKDWQQLVTYFNRLEPSSYPALLQQSLETDVFSEIISVLQQELRNRKVSCMEQLKWLTKVKRFSVAIMFLSKKDRTNLKAIFDGLVELRTNEKDTIDIKQLASDFSVQL